MAQDRPPVELSPLSDWEVVSAYLNAEPGRRREDWESLEAEIVRRRLPLPERPATPPPPPPAKTPMAPETFLAYALLIYTGSALLYAWIYLPERILRRDFQRDLKHHLIQTGIALTYQALEVAAVLALTA